MSFRFSFESLKLANTFYLSSMTLKEWNLAFILKRQQKHDNVQKCKIELLYFFFSEKGNIETATNIS